MVKSNGQGREEKRKEEREKERKEESVLSTKRLTAKELQAIEFKAVGEASLALAQRDHGTHTVYDQSKELLKNIESNFAKCYSDAIKVSRDIFYISKHTRRDGLLQNVSANKYLSSDTCPPPSFGQTVWKCKKSTGSIEELWVLPSEYECIELQANQDLTFEWEWPLLQHVIKYWDGTLSRLCEKENSKIKE